jgi:uncharacterized protein (DUF2147 family)
MKRMKNVFFGAFVLLMPLLFSIESQAQVKGDDVKGVWLNEDKDAHIQVENRDGKYFGKIIWLKEPNELDGKAKLDDENPDLQLQKRPVMGLQLLSDFVFDGDDEWEDGEIYDPKSGKTYSCYMEFEDDAKSKLKVRGYIGVSLIGKTTYWTRVN